MYKDNTSQVIKKLFALHRFGMKPGLERTLKLLEHIDNPQNNFQSIHVAGTNGKGSVSTMIASILAGAGYKVGLYTSPHLVKFNERFQINGNLITDNEIFNIAKPLLKKGEIIGATFFEISTAIAFKWFSDSNVDFAVIETGLGGRYDATNVITPIMSIITSISNDHSEYLGSTLEDIAVEKAGIIKTGVPVIVAESRQSILDIFRKVADENDSVLINSNYEFKNITVNYLNNFSIRFKLSDKSGTAFSIVSPINGIKQIDNIKLVLSASNQLTSKYHISKKNIISGIANAKNNFYFAGRLDLIRDEPMILLDVAHNPDSIDNLVNTLIKSGYKNKKWNLVFGVMNDKDIVSILLSLKKITSKLILTQPKINRAASINQLKLIADDVGFKNTFQFENVDDAIRFALTLNQRVLITGSFYLAGESLQFFKTHLESRTFNPSLS